MQTQELTQLALLGTEREAPPAGTPGTPLGDLLAQLDPAAERERFLLSAAALVFQHERTGRLIAREVFPLPEASGVESLRRVGGRAGAHLLALLEGEQPGLLLEWLHIVAGTQQLAPPEALPGLLSLGAAKPELRDSILPVLGERGRWLAARNPAWTWPAGAVDDETIWQTGEASARLLFLRRLRRVNPVRARELMVSTWKEEAPDDRATFVGALAIGLSPEDEPFLEAALDDKRKEVRRAAAGLLAKLPASALVRRMTERTRPLLKYVGGEAGGSARPKKSKRPVLEVTPPNDCDAAMLRDGIEAKPQAGFGQKAWWLMQMLWVVPLKTWTTEWHLSPTDILRVSSQGDWKKEFFEAWTQAAIRQEDHEWAEVLLAAAMEAKRFDLLDPLVGVLPAAPRERWIAELLAADDKKTRDLHGTLVLQCRHEWSAGFSRAILQWLRRLTAKTDGEWQLRNELCELAADLAPETLGEAAAGWPEKSPGWEFWSKGVDELIGTAQFRQEMRAALQTTS